MASVDTQIGRLKRESNVRLPDSSLTIASLIDLQTDLEAQRAALPASPNPGTHQEVEGAQAEVQAVEALFARVVMGYESVTGDNRVSRQEQSRWLSSVLRTVVTKEVFGSLSAAQRDAFTAGMRAIRKAMVDQPKALTGRQLRESFSDVVAGAALASTEAEHERAIRTELDSAIEATELQISGRIERYERLEADGLTPAWAKRMLGDPPSDPASRQVHWVLLEELTVVSISDRPAFGGPLLLKGRKLQQAQGRIAEALDLANAYCNANYRPHWELKDRPEDIPPLRSIDVAELSTLSNHALCECMVPGLEITGINTDRDLKNLERAVSRSLFRGIDLSGGLRPLAVEWRPRAGNSDRGQQFANTLSSTARILSTNLEGHGGKVEIEMRSIMAITGVGPVGVTHRRVEYEMGGQPVRQRRDQPSASGLARRIGPEIGYSDPGMITAATQAESEAVARAVEGSALLHPFQGGSPGLVQQHL